MGDKKTCFVVTPIGDDNTSIRRHIDGIIDQAIIPAIGEEYEVKVAHREYEIGSINDRVIQSVYNSDLVIANLTELNPNVMFEIAVRYSFGKPAIVIAEKGTKLPFDIVEENTIFYINDPAGAAELKNTIIKFVDRLEKNDDNNTYGPVYSALKKAAEFEKIEMSLDSNSNKEAFSFLVKKINDLEMDIKQNFAQNTISYDNYDIRFDELDMILNVGKSLYQNAWKEIKQEEPFDKDRAESLLRDINDFINKQLDKRPWTNQEKRYIKGKFSFLQQEIRNYIYNNVHDDLEI